MPTLKNPEYEAKRLEALKASLAKRNYNDPIYKQRLRASLALARKEGRLKPVVRSKEGEARRIASVKAHWNSLSQEEKDAVRERARKLSKSLHTPEIRKKIRNKIAEKYKIDPDFLKKVKDHCSKIGLAQKGISKTKPRHAKSPFNACAQSGYIRSPRGIVYFVKNINHFIREHTELFHENDVIWRPSSKRTISVGTCRAAKGLSMLFPYDKNGRLKSSTYPTWKGWTFVSDVEIKEQSPSGRDILDRKEL